jgi:hypothetical protein
MSLERWAAILGIRKETLVSRIRAGWPMERVLGEAVRIRGRAGGGWTASAGGRAVKSGMTFKVGLAWAWEVLREAEARGKGVSVTLEGAVGKATLVFEPKEPGAPA